MKTYVDDCCKCVFKTYAGKTFVVMAPTVRRAMEIATYHYGESWYLMEVHPFSSYSMSMVAITEPGRFLPGIL